MTGIYYCRCELTEPWAIALPAWKGCLSFHVVMSGRCLLEVEGTESRELEPGDLALVPHGEGHCLSSDAGVLALSLGEICHEVCERYAILRHGGGGSPTNLVCGAVRFEHPAAYQLVKLLPGVIHVEASTSPQMDWMQSTLRLMAAEATEPRPGGETVITRLADILIIQAIRSWIERDPAAQSGWLLALQDKQIGRAIMLIHRDPARPWTLGLLAREVAMSRSAFAARFTRFVGEPAMRYLARWRVHLALSWLQEQDAGLLDVATRLGYRSEAAFSRAFKRFMGVSPGAIRRHSDTGESRARKEGRASKPPAQELSRKGRVLDHSVTLERRPIAMK
jgi:AraC-like DNA-binding protein